MQEIYKSALRKARRMVFNNDKYSEIIVFCKYKIDKNIYTRNESTKVWPNGTEAETRVFVTCREAKNFDDYKQHQNETNQQTTNIF